MTVYGGIEAGGTKFLCVIGNDAGEILEQARIPTTTPKETMPQVIDFFKTMQERYEVKALGIASFGPVDPDPHSETFGYITTTPKPGWSHFDFVGTMKEALGLPVGFDTDVNGAALGEYRWGVAQGLHSFIYVTVGTGIGGGGMLNGQRMHGLMHPEMGHIFINQNIEKDPFKGVCPFHKNCLEGLASGPALNKRWGVEHCAQDLPAEHIAWELEADYLAQAFANYVMIASPQRIIVGGGVMYQKGLLPKIRIKMLAYLNGYIHQKTILENIDQYVVAPLLEGRSGTLGAIALAEEALHHEA